MSRAPTGDVPSRALWPFLLLTFVIAWGVMGLFLAAPAWVVGVFGPVSGRHPLFVLAVYAPAIAAAAVVVVSTGWAGLARFLRRLALWRGAPGGWVLLLLGIPLLYVAGSAVKGNLAAWGDDWPGAAGLAGAIAFTLILGPVEEFGWRGVAQPILQRCMVARRHDCFSLGQGWGETSQGCSRLAPALPSRE